MPTKPRTVLALVVAPYLLLSTACQDTERPESWTAAQLVNELVQLEQESVGLSEEASKLLLRSFARRAVHTRLEISGAHVVSVYVRDSKWKTRPYFALTYTKTSYVYLEEVDQEFQAALARHPHWASVAHTTGDRQLMLELALEPSVSTILRANCQIDLTCEIAAVIRGGKSVYCRATSTRVLGCPDNAPG